MCLFLKARQRGGLEKHSGVAGICFGVGEGECCCSVVEPFRGFRSTTLAAPSALLSGNGTVRRQSKPQPGLWPVPYAVPECAGTTDRCSSLCTIRHTTSTTTGPKDIAAPAMATTPQRAKNPICPIVYLICSKNQDPLYPPHTRCRSQRARVQKTYP